MNLILNFLFSNFFVNETMEMKYALFKFWK